MYATAEDALELTAISADQSANRWLSDAESQIVSMFPTIDFAKTQNYAQRHIGLEGVDELLAEAKSNETAYLWEMQALSNQNAKSLSYAKSDKEKTASTNKKFSIAWKIGLVLAILLYVTVNSASNHMLQFIAAAAFCVMFILIPIALVGSFITSVRKKRAAERYSSELNSLVKKITPIAAAYENTNEIIYTKIEDVYLASLDDAHREIVLMRRDQERQHQEALQLQKEHQAAMESAQRSAAIAQQQSAEAVNRLLQIEEERERRRRGY